MKKITSILFTFVMLSFSNLSSADNYFVGLGYSPYTQYSLKAENSSTNSFTGNSYHIITGYYFNALRFYVDIANNTELKDGETKISDYNYFDLGADIFFGRNEKGFYLGGGYRVIGSSKLKTNNSTIDSSSHFYADLGYLHAFNKFVHFDFRVNKPISSGDTKSNGIDYVAKSTNLVVSVIYSL